MGLVVSLLTALAYALAGGGALGLAGPPGYAAPLYPPAGIALAAALVYGRSALPGIWLGAFIVNAGLGLVRGQSGLGLVVLPALIAVGALLQAAVGAWLLRRWVGPEVVLNAPRDIALAGLLGGPLGCLVSPTVATVALQAAGTLPWAEVPGNWLTWWSGDTLGALIAAPLALTLIGRPAADWRPRRRTVGIPLLLALLLVAIAVLEGHRLDELRKRALFERDAARLASDAEDRLQGALHALQALRGASQQARPTLDARGLQEASRWWLEQPPHLQAMGYSERVLDADLARFEGQARADGLSEFRVFDRDGGADRRRRGEAVALRHIEPAGGNRGALGVNALSIAPAREAILEARSSGQPRATAAFELTQGPRGALGLALYQALYQGQPASAEARQAQFSGVVFVTLNLEKTFATLAGPERQYLRWCLKDTAFAGSRLAGPADCEQAAEPVEDFRYERRLRWGGRDFSFTVHSPPQRVPASPREVAWLLTLAGMAAASLLGALLLTVTGHARRTELAVRTGTEELRSEVRERQQAEGALRESGARLRSILDNVPLGVIFLDPRGNLLECNPRLGEMLGHDAQALMGRSVAELVHPEDGMLIRGMRRELLQSRTPSVANAVRLLQSSGGVITARVSISPLRGQDGRTMRMVAVVEDISEHLRLEVSERALRQAEAANRAKSEFLSRMSHELRTPLNAMIGFAQLLGLDREPALVPHQREWTQQIQRAGWHLLELINETLDLARVESGAVQLTLGPVHLQPMVAACLSMVSGQAEQRQVTLHEALDTAALGVMADSTRLKQVLTNLLSNAVKYNRSGGQVTVRSRRAPDGRVEIAVEDTGLGMSEEQMALLFQPYNRLGREHSGIEGTGIGLVIVQRLTELMGGTLGVSSRAGLGSTFVISLPAGDEAQPVPVRYTQTSPAPYQQRLVHYVEDNETNIEVMRGMLAQRSQILLKTSMLGLDGLAAIRRDRPDLVLLDMHLPDISGLELLRHLKQDDNLAEIPVIVVSADATVDHMEQALTLGAMHYVTKPLAVAEFLGLVDQALETADTRWGT